jgi:FixJ family two-component response regulator
MLLDLRLPDQSGLEVLQRIRASDARIVVTIFVTMAKTADAAIEAMKQGKDGLKNPTTRGVGLWTGHSSTSGWYNWHSMKGAVL